MLKCAEGKAFEDLPVVLTADCVSCGFAGIKLAARGTRLVVKDSCVKFLFGGEVSEHHRFRDAGCVGNLLGGGAAKSAFREERDSYVKNLVTSFLTSHARPNDRAVSVIVSIYLFAQISYFRETFLQSKYLLTRLCGRKSTDLVLFCSWILGLWV